MTKVLLCDIPTTRDAVASKNTTEKEEIKESNCREKFSGRCLQTQELV